MDLEERTNRFEDNFDNQYDRIRDRFESPLLGEDSDLDDNDIENYLENNFECSHKSFESINIANMRTF